MSYKTILVPVDPDPVRQAPLAAARAVAALFDGQVVGVGAGAVDAFLEPAMRYMDRAVRQALREEVEAGLARAEAAFRAAMGPGAGEWRAVRDHPLAAIGRLAAGADLIVAGRPAKDAAEPLDLGALVMAAGLPVLLAPEGRAGFTGESVVVGWKNTRETRRAISDALPFLKRARQVLVVGAVESALDTEVAAELDDVAHRLERHGIKAAVEMRTDVGEAGEMLISLADREQADLIVAGAYGHSRAHEWVFGGVTQSLLRYSPAFVLFAR